MAPAALLDAVVAYFNPRRVILFGSRARGDAGPDSDHDLLVIVDDDTPPSRAYNAGMLSGDARSAKISSLRPGRIEIDTESDSGGVLAWHGTYYPGWIAEIDGNIVPILRADVLFRGIEVPAGKHRVVFRFAPFRAENLADALRVALGRPH